MREKVGEAGKKLGLLTWNAEEGDAFVAGPTIGPKRLPALILRFAPKLGTRQRARTANAPSLIPWLVRCQLSCDIQLARLRCVKNARFCDPRWASSADLVLVDSPQG